jgi:hypothetical protein
MFTELIFSHLVLTGGSDPSLCAGFQKEKDICRKPFTALSQSQQETQACAFSP